MMVTKAIVGPHSASKNTNKSRGTRIFMRENTQAEQWEAKSSRLRTTLKMRDIHFSTSYGWGSRGREGQCRDTWTTATFCGGNSISQSNDWASSGPVAGCSFRGQGRNVCLGNVSINSFVARCRWLWLCLWLPTNDASPIPALAPT